MLLLLCRIPTGITEMDLRKALKSLLFAAVGFQLARSGSHSLKHISTGVTAGVPFPEYTLVGLMDGEPFVYYDSNVKKMVPKMDWIEKIEGPDYWTTGTQTQKDFQEIFKTSVAVLMERYNQTTGIHTFQSMIGCELHDDGTSRGYLQHGYDGEDFISLDLNTLTWTAANSKAVITKSKWETTTLLANMWTRYLESTCIELIKKYVSYGKSTLERKVFPEVDLFQKDSSSPVVCYATGFYPREVVISWKKNGEYLHEDVGLRETLPNQDGTFQKRSVLSVSPEKLDRNVFSCVIQHSGMEKEIPVSDRRVLSDRNLDIIVGPIVTVLILIGCAGVFIWKRSHLASGRLQEIPTHETGPL